MAGWVQGEREEQDQGDSEVCLKGSRGMKLSFTEDRAGVEDQELSLGHVKSEMPITHPAGDVK